MRFRSFWAPAEANPKRKNGWLDPASKSESTSGRTIAPERRMRGVEHILTQVGSVDLASHNHDVRIGQCPNMARLVVIITLAATSVPALGVDGGVGRSLPGAWVMPQGGVIGPDPGFSLTVVPVGYSGSISGTQEIPIAGTLVTDISTDVSANYLVPRYVYKTEIPRINLASTLMVPVNWVAATAAAQAGDLAHSTSNAKAGLGDIIMSPLSVGIHFSNTNNLAISCMIFAPTGAFTKGNISNTGLGIWTFMPNIAHTYEWPKQGVELDNFVGFDIYRHNATTNYTSGTIFHWAGMLLKYVSEKRVGFGGIVSNVVQLNNDTGPLADVLHGLQGRAWGSGPVALFVARHENPGVTIQFRWVREFEVRDRLKGDVLLLGLTLKLD